MKSPSASRLEIYFLVIHINQLRSSEYLSGDKIPDIKEVQLYMVKQYMRKRRFKISGYSTHRL